MGVEKCHGRKSHTSQCRRYVVCTSQLIDSQMDASDECFSLDLAAAMKCHLQRSSQSQDWALVTLACGILIFFTSQVDVFLDIHLRHESYYGVSISPSPFQNGPVVFSFI